MIKTYIPWLIVIALWIFFFIISHLLESVELVWVCGIVIFVGLYPFFFLPSLHGFKECRSFETTYFHGILSLPSLLLTSSLTMVLHFQRQLNHLKCRSFETTSMCFLGLFWFEEQGAVDYNHPLGWETYDCSLV